MNNVRTTQDPSFHKGSTPIAFPTQRMRRLRQVGVFRDMIRETELSVRNFVYPLFIVPGSNVRKEIASMPGCYHLSADMAAREAEEIARLGIPAVLLFGLPPKKDRGGSGAYDPNGVIQHAVRSIKRAVPNLVVITDVCLCAYTDHGHCGIIVDKQVDNDQTIAVLARTALSHVAAGADMVAPSDMMDGRVGAIRQELDAHRFGHIPIMAYSAKYASVFYEPFREAAESVPQFGDRRGYQMDPSNAREALREMELDVLEGADILMVKPALAYLDVLAMARERFDHPLAAYNVSGEYAMICAADRLGWLDGARASMEVLTAIRRAGADIIITYFAKDAAQRLRNG